MINSTDDYYWSLFALIINYFNERGSNVFMASLVASKAFDHVNHFKLYTSLMKKNVPTAFLDVVINWYCKMNVIVRWNIMKKIMRFT